MGQKPRLLTKLLTMSQTFVSGFIIIAVQILRFLGVEVGSEELTTTITTLLTIGSGLWILFRRFQAGGVDKLGRRV